MPKPSEKSPHRALSSLSSQLSKLLQGGEESTPPLNLEELAELLEALRSSIKGDKKPKEEHDKDESWLDWLLDKAVTYGPKIAEAVMAAL